MQQFGGKYVGFAPLVPCVGASLTSSEVHTGPVFELAFLAMSNGVEHGHEIVWKPRTDFLIGSKKPIYQPHQLVAVIDDDASVRAALKELVESVGVEVRLYPAARAFLEHGIPDATACLVLDVRLPEMSGIKVQEELARTGVDVPIVFVTGHGDVAMAVRAMKAGAIDFLTKPFRSQDLLDAVFVALERDRVRREMQQLHSTLREHYESLSAREREVIARVAAGKLNKQIAADLGLSEVTVKLHRANAMRKMCATSLAHLIKMLDTAAGQGCQNQ